MTDLPPLPKLTKAERRKICGACSVDIRKDRKARSTGLCYTCRKSITQRGRPLVPFCECKCECSRHHTFRCVDDGACGDAVNRHVTVCCFRLDGTRGPGNREFRALFNDYEKAFLAAAEAVRKVRFEKLDKERRERWARGERLPNEAEGPQLITDEIKSVEPYTMPFGREFFARSRKLKNDWSPEAVEDLKKTKED